MAAATAAMLLVAAAMLPAQLSAQGYGGVPQQSGVRRTTTTFAPDVIPSDQQALNFHQQNPNPINEKPTQGFPTNQGPAQGYPSNQGPSQGFPTNQGPAQGYPSNQGPIKDNSVDNNQGPSDGTFWWMNKESPFKDTGVPQGVPQGQGCGQGQCVQPPAYPVPQGVPQGGHQPGVPQGGHQPGVPQGGHQPGVPQGNNPDNPFLSPGGSKPGPEYVPAGGHPVGGQGSPLTVTCSGSGYLCVSKASCSNGVVVDNGAGFQPSRSGVQQCNTATETCCRLPSGGQFPPPTSGGQFPPPPTGGNYPSHQGQGTAPGTNGIPIGGSIYDVEPQAPQPRPTPNPVERPNTDPLNIPDTGSIYDVEPQAPQPRPTPNPVVHPNTDPLNIPDTGSIYDVEPQAPQPRPTPNPVEHPNTDPLNIPDTGSIYDVEPQAPQRRPTPNPVVHPNTDPLNIPDTGSIYDGQPQVQRPRPTPNPVVHPYTGPLNTTPYPGCAAALKCVELIYCTAEGVMTDTPVALTRDQEENRVPLSECSNPETGILGKCCRDPNYKDPWPAGMMMQGGGGHGHFNDGLYHPDPTPAHTQHHQGAPSGQFSNQQGPTPHHQQPKPFPQRPPPQQNFPQQQQNFPQQQQNFPQQQPSFPKPQPVVPQQPYPQQNFPQQQQNFPKPVVPQQPSFTKPQPVAPQQPYPQQNFPQQQPSFPKPQPVAPQQPYPQQQPSFPKPQPVAPLPSFPQQPGPGAVNFPQNIPQQTGYPKSPGTSIPVQVAPLPGAKCGVRRPVDRNQLPQDEAGFGEFPWHVMVLSSATRQPVCSGALVSDRAIVTPAHCIKDMDATDILVECGVGNLGSNSGPLPAQSSPVAAVARHPHYDAGSQVNDLAVLILSGPVSLDQHVDTVCLPERGTTHAQRGCLATGYGKQAIQANSVGAPLHTVGVSLIANTECEHKLKQTHLGNYFVLNPSFQCAVPTIPAHDLCKVDAGGPIACERGDGQYELAGLYSWDTGCSQASNPNPTVLAATDSDWIQSVLSRPVEDILRDELNEVERKKQSHEVVDQESKPGFSQGYGRK